MAPHPEPDSEHDELLAEPFPELEAVRREVVLDATPDEVWAQFEGDGALGGWLADEVDVELRPGAEGTVRDDGGPERPVTIEEVVPGRRLGLRWQDVGDRPSLVEIGLEPVGGDRTRVVVLEVPVAVLSLVAPAAERVLAVAGPGGDAHAGGPVVHAGALALAGVR
ncbi:SRPBCC family protein [Patulibacter minatonensis]|uniref:SRPBCC family protein n=1 Tax=Patulibacter minatonensis TaxID=298163 RepID=UPI00047B0DA1|nr:SRPBCC domain-containing protein [Patulibacter minatonensis]